ncbi:MAG TPA: CocE/NonD family hydrolase [Stellaceae bacterium]|nr:CocE/NonD family hydrolase [Stellaceae bacterium]
MDRRAFLHSATLAAASSAVTVAASSAAETPPAAGGRDWSKRAPKGAPAMKRFDEQRWVLDNVIRANGIDWDQSHTAVMVRSCGPDVVPDMASLRERVKRLVDILPAFEAMAKKREALAKESEQLGDKIVARDNYFIAANYWAAAMWTIDELNDRIKMQNDKKRETFAKYMALADHHIEWAELPYRGKTLPAIFHLPPGYKSGDKVPVIVAVSGMDGNKERSVALHSDSWMERGFAVLAMEGPGYWEAPVRGLYVDVPGWAETGKTIADWLAARPEIDAGKIGMTGVSFGSFFSAIMMASDSRFKACAVTGCCYEPGGWTIFEKASPTFKKRFMFMSGITDEAEFDEFRKTIDWNGYAQNVKGAYLVATGEYDQLCPLEHTETFMKALGGPKQLVVYEGGDHSIGSTAATSNGPEPRRYQAEWMEARLKGVPLASERWFVEASGKITKAAIA